jgi:hypothetical protein
VDPRTSLKTLRLVESVRCQEMALRRKTVKSGTVACVRPLDGMRLDAHPRVRQSTRIVLLRSETDK